MTAHDHPQEGKAMTTPGAKFAVKHGAGITITVFALSPVALHDTGGLYTAKPCTTIAHL